MKGVFDIMKTNKITKLMIALLAALTVFSLAATAFAQTGTDTTGENTDPQAEASAQTVSAHDKHGHKDGKNRPGHAKKYNDDRFEDWFEDRIDARRHDVDFSQLPENPTDEEMLDFFKQNFLGDAPEKKSDAKPERPMKKDRKADRFEDWFEDRIDARGHRVDFSQLGEDPTDEEIVEFFKENFMGNGSGHTGDGKTKDRDSNKSGKPSGGSKDSPLNPDQPDTEQAPKSEPAPENIEPAPVEQPTEEGVKDKA